MIIMMMQLIFTPKAETDKTDVNVLSPRMAKLSLQDRGWDFVPQLAALPGEAVVDKPGCAPQAVDTKLNQQHEESCIPFEPSGLGLSV
jgi:hypothetical protein